MSQAGLLGKMRNRILDDTVCFKILWAMLVILKINPLISRKTSPLFILLIVYGLFIILYDFLKCGKLLRNKYISFIALFILFMSISTIINFRNDFIGNIKYLASTIIQLVVIGGMDVYKEKQDVIKEIKLINNIIIMGITLASLISIMLLIFGINGSYSVVASGSSLNESLYHYGVAYGGRLVGIYSNPNRFGAFASISIICSIANLTLANNSSSIKVGYYFSIVFNFLCLVLTDSRTSIISLLIGIFVLAFMWLIYQFRDERNNLTKYLIIIGLSCLCIVLVYGSICGIRKGVVAITQQTQSIVQNEGTMLSLGRANDNPKLDINKASSGRITIWKVGLNTAKKNLAFGVGQSNLYDIVIENWNGERIPSGIKNGGIHNIFIETLVSYGLPTFLVLCAFLLVIAIDLLKSMVNSLYEDENSYFIMLSILTMLGFITTNNMTESMVLYFTNIPSFIFMLYLGYAMYFVQQDDPAYDSNIVYKGYRQLMKSIELDSDRRLKDKSPSYLGVYNRYIKRAIGFILAVILLMPLLPIYAIIALCIFIESGRPIFYKAKRAGYQGKSFEIYKFRSMVKNADKIGGGTTALNDSRITKVGKILRKTKLDEIPQLLNVIKGDMCFIGPRPELLKYAKLYEGEEEKILQVRPGITDFSSIEFVSLDEVVGNENPDEMYEKHVLPRKNQLRIKYAEEVSFRVDMYLFFKTIGAVLNKVIKPSSTKTEGTTWNI